MTMKEFSNYNKWGEISEESRVRWKTSKTK